VPAGSDAVLSAPDAEMPPRDGSEGLPPVSDVACPPDTAPPPPARTTIQDGRALELALDDDFTESAGQAAFTPLRPDGLAPANRASGGVNQPNDPTEETTDNGAHGGSEQPANGRQAALRGLVS